VDYPVILGCPWLSHHVAEISFSRKQVILRKSNGQYVTINPLSAAHSDIEETQLSFLGDGTSLPSDSHLWYKCQRNDRLLMHSCS
jgi:hypothetical protein